MPTGGLKQQELERRLLASHQTLLTEDDLIPDARLREGGIDAFQHAAIAGRVAELVSATITPCNIALFGPWGSGKSSFHQLLVDAVARRELKVDIVRYDAWKFGGQSLKRNFISNAAAQLDIETSPGERTRSKFHEGLHQGTSSVDLTPAKFRSTHVWKQLLFLFVFALGLIGVLSATWALIMLADDQGFWGTFVSTAEPVAVAVLSSAGITGVALAFLETAKVTAIRKAPSEDDEFDRLLHDLIGEAKTQKSKITNKKVERLVFFIDELDRCSGEDVVATLTSLRTFLDQEDCVFIVAADRDVLEEALRDDLDQRTPVNEDEPYYSTASAFIDKIFQYQFALPPLRSQRLTGFARELAMGANGVWAELRAVDGGVTFDNVLYTLIPAHVRSPRRVKVLLNAFVTNVRVAQARNIEWQQRSTELAKLTALQVEFPNLAADLHLEPSLLDLLMGDPVPTTERQRLFLRRHQWRSDVAESAAELTEEPKSDFKPPSPDGSAQVAPDELLVGAADQELRNRQYEDLLRYLRSRKDVAPNPSRDLIYLEVAGAAVGIEDSDLGRLVEDEAATNPGSVRAAMEHRTATERLAVANALGRQSEIEFGPERDNVVTALAYVLADVSADELRLDDMMLVRTVEGYLSERPLSSEQLPGLLALAVAAGAEGKRVAGVVIGHPDFAQSDENLMAAAKLIDRLDPDHAKVAAELIAQMSADNDDFACAIISEHPPDVVAAFVEAASSGWRELFRLPRAELPARAGRQAVPADPGGPDAGDFVGHVLDAFLDRETEFGGAAIAFAILALDRFYGGEGPVIERAAALAEMAPDVERRNTLLLRCLCYADVPEWSSLGELLREGGADSSWAGEALLRVVATAWTSTGLTAQARAAAIEELPRLVSRLVAYQPSGAVPDVEDSIRKALAGLDCTAPDAAETLQHLLSAIESLRTAGEEMADPLDAALSERVAELIAPGVDLTDAVTGIVVAMFAALPAAELHNVRKSLDARRPADIVAAPGFCRLDIALAREQTIRAGVVGKVSPDVVVACGAEKWGSSVVPLWLDTRPAAGDVVAMLADWPASPTGLVEPVRKWAAGESSSTVAELFEGLFELGYDQRLLGAAAHGVDRVRVAQFLAERLDQATNRSQRKAVVDAVKQLRPETYPESRPLAEASLRLIESKPDRGKIEVAGALVRELGSRHQMKRKIQDSLTERDEAGDVSKEARRDFEKAGYKFKKRGALRGFFGGGA